ncbi:MAG: nitrogen regulation protein NR(I) [Wenzhouxiangella sp.]
MTETIWVIDDDPGIRYVLEEYLSGRQYRVSAFAGSEGLRQALEHGRPDLVIADIRLEGENGIELMRRLREEQPDLPVIVMTAYSDLDSAVRAFRGGAFEFVAKPFDLDEIGRLVSKALEHTPASPAEASGSPGLIGSSPAFQEIIRLIGRLSASDVPVLITGETGTGKELVARALHRHSPRAQGPFIALNTAAIPKDLLESELFGYEKGAFTGAAERHAGHFERAAGGTLFLDEIGDMPESLQSRLLRVLAEGEFYRLGGRGLVRADVRIITATHHDLRERIEAGRFRADLYHRLKVVGIEVPPLRERREDIPELIEHFLRQAAEEFHLPRRTAQPTLIDHLQRLDWPGNVRELKHLCQSMTALAPGQAIGLDDLPDEYRPDNVRPAVDAGWTAMLAEDLTRRLNRGESGLHAELVREFERTLAENALAACKGNRSETARRLGISRNTLARMLE